MKKFKSVSELNLAIKMAAIAMDAVQANEKEVKTSKFKGRVVTSSSVWSTLRGLIGNEAAGIVQKTLGYGGALAIIGIIYAGGRRIGSLIKDIINKDPKQLEFLPDPYEYIKREGVEYPGYKFKWKHKPDKSRQVAQDFYSELNRYKPWYEKAQEQKTQQILDQSGIPANYGIAPGFGVGDSRIKDTSFYDSMKKYNCSERLMKVFAQSRGIFKSETIDKLQGPKLAPNSQNWIDVNNWEQFLAQDPQGQWAAMPSADASFYDPSRTLGRDKPMRWDPAGYGKDFYQEKIGDRLEVAKERLEAFNEPEAQRQAAKIIFLNRQINLREEKGNITPNQAAQLRKMLVLLQEQNNPEVAEEIENLVRSAIAGGFYTMPGQSDYTGMPEEQINWDNRVDPIESNPEYRKVLDRSMGLFDQYRENERYQNILGDSEVLS